MQLTSIRTQQPADSHTKAPAGLINDQRFSIEKLQVTNFLLECAQSDQNQTLQKTGAIALLIIYIISGAMAVEASLVLVSYVVEEITDSIATSPGLIEARLALSASIKKGVIESIEQVAESLVNELMAHPKVTKALTNLKDFSEAAILADLEEITNNERFKAAVLDIKEPALEIIADIITENGMKMLGLEAPAEDEAVFAEEGEQDKPADSVELHKLRAFMQKATVAALYSNETTPPLDPKGIQADLEFIALKKAFATSLKDSIVYTLAIKTAGHFGIHAPRLPEDDLSPSAQFGAIASKVAVNFFNTFNMIHSENQEVV